MVLRKLIEKISKASTPSEHKPRGDRLLANLTNFAQLTAALVKIAVNLHRW